MFEVNVNRFPPITVRASFLIKERELNTVPGSVAFVNEMTVATMVSGRYRGPSFSCPLCCCSFPSLEVVVPGFFLFLDTYPVGLASFLVELLPQLLPALGIESVAS